MAKIIEDDKPLPRHTKLDYYECYAKIVLEEMFPERFSNLDIVDKPDLQNKNLDIGIEVTSSVNPMQKKAESEFVKWWNDKNANKKKIESKIKECGAELIDGSLNGVRELDNFDRVYKIIENKRKKLLSDQYKHFGKLYLFIHSYIFADITMQEEALGKMQSICYSETKRIDCIYVLVPGAIYVFDLANNITYDNKIDSNTQCRQAESAREMVVKMEME